MNELSTDNIFYIVCGTAVLIMLIYYIRRRRRIISVFFGMASGLAALFVMNRFGYMIGGELPLNTFNVCGSAVLGIPFVAFMILIKYL